eukprot:203457-Chlamydomonas_euryale.AAC.5
MDVRHGLVLAGTGVGNVVQPILVWARKPGSAFDPGPGLVNGALRNHCDSAEEDGIYCVRKSQCEE